MLWSHLAKCSLMLTIQAKPHYRYLPLLERYERWQATQGVRGELSDTTNKTHGKRTLLGRGEILRFDGHLTSAEYALVDSDAGRRFAGGMPRNRQMVRHSPVGPAPIMLRPLPPAAHPIRGRWAAERASGVEEER
jgi:hypothetical protein